MHFLIFVLVFLLVMAAANFYIYRRFLRKLTALPTHVAWLIPALLMLGELLFVLDNAFNLIPDSLALYFIASAVIGFTFMLFVVATFYDLTMTVSRRVPFDQGRRRVLKILFDITMLIAATSYLLRGLSQGLKPPEINRVRVKLKDFPFERYSIVQLSDVHVGRTIKREFVADLVDRTNQLAPDLVVITGDLIDWPMHRIIHDLEPLRDIKAPCYFILGNHEYFHGAQVALNHIRSLGIQPLLNECVRLGSSGRQFNLVGVNDLFGEGAGVLPPDFAGAFATADPELATIVLSHQPKSVSRVESYRCDLMLSGHTHGGQIFPFGYLVMMQQPYLEGLHTHRPGLQIFVSRGTGYWGPPLRILAPSEITLLQISPAI